MTGLPIVSVLMTAYNREEYISEAIESVLLSNFKDFELIIVDDLSTDSTLSIAKQFAASDDRVKVYQNERNLGDYPNRNVAARLASGRYLKYVDSDDKIYPETLGFMVDVMERFPEAAFCMSARSHDVLPDDVNYLSPRESYLQHFFSNGFLDNGPLACMIRKSCFDYVGGFPEERMVGDVSLWLKLAAIYPLVRIKGGLVFWREHAGQEFKSGFEYYLVEGLRVYINALKSPSCPLSKDEVKRAIKKKKQYHKYLLFRYFIKERKVRNSIRLLNRLKAVSN